MSEFPGNDGATGPVANVGEGVEATTVQIKVNGISIEVTKEVIVEIVLTKAKNAGCIQGLVEEYVIERVSEEGQLSRETTIVVEEAEEFVAVPVEATPVA